MLTYTDMYFLSFSNFGSEYAAMFRAIVILNKQEPWEYLTRGTCTYNVKLRRLRVIIFAVEKQ
jgi:hypothetical protein